MKAVYLDDTGLSVRDDLEQPTLQSDEVLVKVLKAGICETDLQLVKGYMQFQGVLGHEFVGIAKTGKYVGQRVVGEINCHCRQCAYCRNGLGNHCPNRTVLGILNHDGAFAEYVAVPQVNLHRIPDSLCDDYATFVEPVAAAFRLQEQLPLDGDETIIVLGDGRLGNLCAQVLKLAGCEHLLVVGKHPEKLAILREMGLQTVVLNQLEKSKRADIVVDCTGSPTGLPLALELVKPCGTVVMKTTVAGEHHLSMAPVVIDEVTLIGSRCGPFEPAIDALAGGRIIVEPLINATYPLDDAPLAMVKAESPGAFKILLEP
ncbi:MAG: alcohol dehydrogenase catalytic domain-containing protein [Planctomycetaceae bacterium]|nr:alcohol dehydrogenase catalytic domain-containing protein [Planctomycetaceae bacterium]